MDVDRIEDREQRLAGRHVAAGIVAAVVSIALHVAALMGLSNARFGWPVAGASSRRAVEAMRVAEVRRAPENWRQGSEGEGEGVASWVEELGRAPEEAGLPVDELATEPEPVEREALMGETRAIAEPGTMPRPEAWRPERHILEIQDRLAAEDRAILERRLIPRVERVEDVAGIASPEATAPEAPGMRVPGPTTASAPGGDWTPVLVWRPGEGGATVAEGKAQAEPARDLLETAADEVAEEITPLKPIENFLTVRLTVYDPRRDPRYGYFRMDIERAGPDILPVVPRDVVFVQDCSNSMAEQRLRFCRQGLTNCLAALGPDDRFNVVGFRERASWCFEGWTPVNADTTDRARAFIGGMRSEGNTDIITSIGEVVRAARTPGRPVIVILITDGRATTGLTASTDIIGAFSRLNDGAVSVFTLGTVQTANRYLLDLLSACNRGESLVVTRGRWDIPDAIASLHRSLKRPVLSDVGFRFAGGGECEVYPVQTSNLYLDRPLVLMGRYTRGTERIVCQAVGVSGDTPCDMVFDLDPARGTFVDDEALRLGWAEQKLYHLMGEYARSGRAEVLRDIRATAKQYGLDVPYRREL